MLKTGYKMASALDTILALQGMEKLITVMEGMGYDAEKRREIVKFLNENITEEEFNSNVEVQAFNAYIEGLQEMEKYMEMAKGYQEMGDINLTITQEDFHLEEEGAKAYEMDSKKIASENNAG